jgi:hypothetical protein
MILLWYNYVIRSTSLSLPSARIISTASATTFYSSISICANCDFCEKCEFAQFANCAHTFQLSLSLVINGLKNKPPLSHGLSANTFSYLLKKSAEIDSKIFSPWRSMLYFNYAAWRKWRLWRNSGEVSATSAIPLHVIFIFRVRFQRFSVFTFPFYKGVLECMHWYEQEE